MHRDGERGIDVRQGRRRFLAQSGSAVLFGLSAAAGANTPAAAPGRVSSTAGVAASISPQTVRLFLCGDVMTGRGVDQIMRHPGDPALHESFVRSATEYVAIAEEASGPIPRRVDPSYIWGDALGELDRSRPDVRIVNLETAVTAANEPWPGKGIHYRMHPSNVDCLSAAKIDCCALANNHVLDWGHEGLRETISTLRAAGILTAGAGADETEARVPAVMAVRGGGRILVFAYASPSSGIPPRWAARGRQAGVSVLDESQPTAVNQVLRELRGAKRPGDVLVVSIHWGGNWGYEVPRDQQRLARGLVDEAGVDVVFGHSSHHPRPVEVHGGKLILYGCGDFLNDYEGIGGHEGYRPELGLMYLPDLDPASGRLQRLVLVPTCIRGFRVNRACAGDAEWLQEMMTREGRALGTRIEMTATGELELRWEQTPAGAKI
jgi:poly-gamma-glutamate synthesis protein (capsule biosynthesis protein)